VVCASFTPRAQDAVFFMALPPEVLPVDVGATAYSIVGLFYEGGALSWMPTSGTTSLGGQSAVSVSLDGRTIIGNVLNPQGFETAAIWQTGTTWRLLGGLTPTARPCDLLLSASFGASDDGRVIVGLGWDGCSIARAFRWDETTGMVNLGTSNARSTRANNVSGDGRVIVGWQESDVGFRQGAKWVDRQQQIIANAAGRVVGEARAANRDGSIITGQTCDAFNPSPEDPTTSAGWKWTRDGGMQCLVVQRPPLLPNRPYTTMVMDTSDDGRVMAGSYSFGLNAEGLIWIDDQPHFVRDYLRANGFPDAFRGWVNTGFVTGVSPDGRTLVGYGAGPTAFQGYLIMLPGRGAR
jgi:probable HAF family extracellular repeat protein